MTRLLPLTLALGLLPAAHAEVRVSVNPLPYGSVQLSHNQYMVPNVNGINVLVYSDRPLPFAQPGQPYASQQSIVIDPLPYGAVRMNDTQYLLKSDGMTIMLMANSPLAFKETSLTMPSTTPNELATGRNTPPAQAPVSTAPLQLALEPVLQPQAALTGAQAVPVIVRPAPQASAVPARQSTVAQLGSLPYSAEGQSALERIRNRTGSTASRVNTQEPTKAPASTVSLQPAVTAPLITEVRQSSRTPRRVNFQGLPAGVDGYVLASEENGQVKLAYSIINRAQDTYVLNPVKLSLKQEGTGLRASLDRRNGSLAPGVIPSGQGEMGTITLARATNAPINLTWTMQNQVTGENYQLSYSY